MAITITNESIGSKDGSANVIKYVDVTEADTSPEVIEWVEWADRSVQVFGTFNGGTLAIEGSNDGTNWVTLNDPQANPLTFTTAKIEQVLEITRYVRPRVTAGTGVSLTVIFLLRRASSMRN